MTSTLSFHQTSSPNPATPERLTEVLANPGFGQHFTDHMVTIRWSSDQGWHSAALEPYHALTLDPAATVLHYGQAIFEGLKAYRHQDGSIVAFRPDANAERFRNSARRLAMPELPASLFIESLHQLVSVDSRWVPDRAEASLYLRPFMISDESTLGVNRPANHYLYALIASPAGPYFASGVKPVKVWLCTDYVRAAPGGTGAAKCAGNYAASFAAQAQAVAEGCDQVVWLDGVERRWVEEVGAMNLFFVFGDRLVTPELSGALLPGITRDSLLTLARDLGYTVEERRISTDEWEKKAKTGELTEVFGCGTAAVITPVGSVKSAAGEFTVSGGQPGEVTMKLRAALNDLQRGAAPDTHGWIHRLV
ncbi:branched-chain amino acid aminotransferase [Kibdelosporangium phytohabitans]|uniref:Branched-chain-amino-acid aminotransferase n=1 Tax=Kibdelosporangium phytohabitans TaxID=860235 RepID=A0A0N9HS72_9PSEU|nr:branched-chain amino acid aminotransferase [Kibdelosporangium phytohabitans]ALG07770.1 branched-chain amino acid aminotransferase [Kibdelosporangium phytohabitans]MBE1471316.1 branched-chain amino acid aminotransferase [Kibdelosporangium phytohabitans]